MSRSYGLIQPFIVACFGATCYWSLEHTNSAKVDLGKTVPIAVLFVFEVVELVFRAQTIIGVWIFFEVVIKAVDKYLYM